VLILLHTPYDGQHQVVGNFKQRTMHHDAECE
jgi:hypothetical protein